MTCKDCIHYSMCYLIEHYGRLLETEEPCKDFKNKANYVEVVRCCECGLATEDILLDGYYHCQNNGLSHKTDCYCNYGKRRDT